MKITIESTTKMVEVQGGVKCRVWEGKTDTGIEVQVLVPRIAAIAEGGDLSQFERELQEMKPPSAAVDAFPLRMIL